MLFVIIECIGDEQHQISSTDEGSNPTGAGTSASENTSADDGADVQPPTIVESQETPANMDTSTYHGSTQQTPGVQQEIVIATERAHCIEQFSPGKNNRFCFSNNYWRRLCLFVLFVFCCCSLL